ncbi:hypothetical protein PILCRDRAFT_91502 [Piloderma croceum F 1598]|uniref:Uncharacterized protein n=1 Tax=Piloderma croceum (strain F 1598) TaxID=765440 RepID=A0A0C3AS44_PILCF|nr:hypothetical protein PILCRDRAFT_91502 [Piloderma croceum F 1598]
MRLLDRVLVFVVGVLRNRGGGGIVRGKGGGNSSVLYNAEYFWCSYLAYHLDAGIQKEGPGMQKRRIRKWSMRRQDTVPAQGIRTSEWGKSYHDGNIEAGCPGGST